MDFTIVCIVVIVIATAITFVFFSTDAIIVFEHFDGNVDVVVDVVVDIVAVATKR